jgi:chromosomal replication initiation ATPase DnaA
MSNSKNALEQWLGGAKPDFDNSTYLNAVSDLTGVSVDDIFSDHRWGNLAKARHLYWACLRRFGGWSYPEIGYHANRNHTTIIQGVGKVPEEVLMVVENHVKHR